MWATALPLRRPRRRGAQQRNPSSPARRAAARGCQTFARSAPAAGAQCSVGSADRAGHVPGGANAAASRGPAASPRRREERSPTHRRSAQGVCPATARHVHRPAVGLPCIHVSLPAAARVLRQPMPSLPLGPQERSEEGGPRWDEPGPAAVVTVEQLQTRDYVLLAAISVWIRSWPNH
eukprot:1279354-Prymnesium_polylepis.1